MQLGSTPKMVKTNLKTLLGILVRTSRPGVWAKLELTLEDGILMDRYGMKSTLRTKGKLSTEIEEILDAVLGDVTLDGDVK